VRPVDVIWVTTKATQLADALERVPATAAEDSVVVPPLNGLEHRGAAPPAVGRCGRSWTTISTERVALIGPNGVGKSSLLNGICGIVKPGELRGCAKPGPQLVALTPDSPPAPT
jgi:ketopantoate reductase